MNLKRNTTILYALILSCLFSSVGLAQLYPPVAGGGTPNITEECGAGSTTTCTVGGLSLTVLDPALLQCHTATAIVPFTFTSSGSPITSIVFTYSATAGVVCAVNTSGATGASGMAGTNGAGYGPITSPSSLTIGLGTQAFTIGTGYAYSTGALVIATYSSNSADYMVGTVTSYTGGVLT